MIVVAAAATHSLASSLASPPAVYLLTSHFALDFTSTSFALLPLGLVLGPDLVFTFIWLYYPVPALFCRQQRQPSIQLERPLFLLKFRVSSTPRSALRVLQLPRLSYSLQSLFSLRKMAQAKHESLRQSVFELVNDLGLDTVAFDGEFHSIAEEDETDLPERPVRR